MSTADKHLERKKRNRDSAAAARDRKKAHIKMLEKKIEALTNLTHRLESENAWYRASIEEIRTDIVSLEDVWNSHKCTSMDWTEVAFCLADDVTSACEWSARTRR